MAIYFNYAVPEALPLLNEKLLDCVLKHIEEHPGKHNQNLWIQLGSGRTLEEVECGTAACVAGWACLLTLPPEVSYPAFCGSHFYSTTSHTDHPDHVKQKAKKLLGLTDVEASTLFKAAEGTRAEVLSIVKERVRDIKLNRGLK